MEETMATRKRTNAGKGWLIGGALALGAAALYYLKSGAGADDAMLIPNTIEGRLDRVVEALNQRFGKRWVNQTLSTLQHGLSTILPAPLVALVDTVYQVEQYGRQAGLSGYQKRCQAAGMCPV
jgi:hypothetical protein